MPPTSKVPRTVKNTDLVRSMFGRRGMHMRTTSKALDASATTAEMVATPRAGGDGNTHAKLSSKVKGRKVEIPVDNPDKAATDLKRKPKGIIRWFKYLPSRIRNFYHILRPIPTPDEIEAKKFARIEKEHNKLCAAECRKFGKQISSKLGQLGLQELLNSPDPNKPKKLKLVRWSVYTRDELFTKDILRMDTNPKHLPAYVKVSELGRNPLYSDELLPTLGHYNKWESDEAGVFCTVYRHGLDGLPEFVAAEVVWKKVPDNKPPLTFVVGYGDNSTRIDVDLDDCPHMIVAGATKQGKSNFINQMICFWLWRGLTKEDLQLVLFDLKRGMEFTFYEGLPHLYHDTPEEIERQKDDYKYDHTKTVQFIETGIIEELKDVMPALLRLRHIMDQRLLFIKKEGYKDFNAYNRAQHSRQNKLPSMVVIFDEWARIKLSLGAEPESLLAEMTNLARAAGMYFVIGTQNPNTAVISPLIGVNFSTRVVFKCSIGGSMSALGNQSAKDLEEKGRAILQDGGDETKLQTPRISDGLIQSVVFKAITGKEKKFSNAIDLEEILKYSLDHFKGELDYHKLYEAYRTKKIRQDWMSKALREAEGKSFVLSGISYKVKPRGSTSPRKLVPEDPLPEGNLSPKI
jgi:hypothetical protein